MTRRALTPLFGCATQFIFAMDGIMRIAINTYWIYLLRSHVIIFGLCMQNIHHRMPDSRWRHAASTKYIAICMVYTLSDRILITFEFYEWWKLMVDGLLTTPPVSKHNDRFVRHNCNKKTPKHNDRFVRHNISNEPETCDLESSFQKTQKAGWARKRPLNNLEYSTTSIIKLLTRKNGWKNAHPENAQK